MEANNIFPPETAIRNYGMYVLGVDCAAKEFYIYLPKTQERIKTMSTKQLKVSAKDLIITAGYLLTRSGVMRLNRRINDLDEILRVREFCAAYKTKRKGGNG